MPTHRQKVSVYLDPEAVEMIRARCSDSGIDPTPERGRVGGPTEWIRRLILRELGLPAPVDPHEEQSKERKGRPRATRQEK